MAPTPGCRSLVTAPSYGYCTKAGSQEATPAPRSPDPEDSKDSEDPRDAEAVNPGTAAAAEEDRPPSTPAWRLIALDPGPTVDYAAAPLGDPRRRAAPNPVPWYGAARTTWHRYPLTPRVACRIIPAERLRDSPASPKKPFPRPDVDDEVYDAVFTF